MARVTTQVARKEYKCGKCGETIHKGEKYKKAKLRYSPTMFRCMKFECRFRQSDLKSSDKLSRAYAVVEMFEDSAFDDEKPIESLQDLSSLLDDACSQIQEISDEYNESADNIEEHFSETDQSSECREKAENLDSWRDDLETHQSEIDSTISDLEDYIDKDFSEEEKSEYEDAIEEARSKFEDAVNCSGECPV